MAPSWRSQGSSGLGAYTTVAQTEDPTAELTTHGKVTSLDHDGNGEQSVDHSTTPSAQDLSSLPRVADSLPLPAFLIAIVELCERFAYYGLSGPFQNYIANPPKSTLPGALGLGQSSATAMTNFFQFWCFVTPVIGAVIADQYLGKYATIKWFSVVYMVGIIILFLTSLPASVERGYAFPGLVVAMMVIGLGTGGIKSNVAPLIAEQISTTEAYVKTIKGGKRVVVDPEATIQRVFMVYYTCINIGSISAITTTMLELHVGFWSAYLLPLVMFVVGFALLVQFKDRYTIKSPQGGVIGNCVRAFYIALGNGFNLDAARPSQSATKHRITWNEKFVDELQTALVACKAFLFFPIYWVTFSQMMNNFVSQAGQMELDGLPNDILPNIDPVAVILLIPLFDRLLYPFLRTKLELGLGPTARISLGFLFAASAMVYAGILQTKIDGYGGAAQQPAQRKKIHFAWQAPAYILMAVSEILACITGLELAYAKAPENMKSLIMSLFLLTVAGGSVLGIVIAPFAQDPWLLQWMYFGLGLAAAGTGVAFWRVFGEQGEEKQQQQEEEAGAESFEMAERV
ncbi:ATP-dependent DNA helicase chl1 [Pleosporales sp. CAS-2024a]